LALVSARELLDAGMHYGHHVSRWNPKMAPYIFGKRNAIHIIDLRSTIKGLVTAYKFVRHVVAGGKSVVFVGTKRQARDAIKEKAAACGMPYVSERWLGGTLTNFRTIRSRLERLEELESIVEGPDLDTYSKKEGARMKRELGKIKRNLEGIRNMDELPGAIVIIDPKREKNAVAEAQRLNIPTICLGDTDCDPDWADILIPGNDCAMRSVSLVLSRLNQAVEAGKEHRREIARQEAERAAAESAARAKEQEAAKEAKEAQADERRKKAEAETAREKAIAAAAHKAAEESPASLAAANRRNEAPPEAPAAEPQAPAEAPAKKAPPPEEDAAPEGKQEG
jgi:small subunit ribosomal protein S2